MATWKNEKQEGGGDKIYRAFLEDFIDFLDLADVKNLVKASAGMAIGVSDKKEAVSMLLHFTDAYALLHRQKCTKEILTKYIVKRKIPCVINKSTIKANLVTAILKFWHNPHLADVKSESKPNLGDLKGNVKDEHEGKPNVVAPSRGPQNSIGTQADAVPDLVSSGMQTIPNNCRDVTPLYSPAQDNEEDGMELDEFPQTEEEKATGQKMAYEFSNWFYPRLNQLTEFQPADFWRDSSLLMFIESGSQVRKFEALSDGVQVCRTLRSLVAEHGCYFLPNNLNGTGIRGMYSPHGLAQVVVCGTVHKGPAAVGIFDQTFGLLRDPNDQNNFKVKFTVLKYREQGLLMNAVTDRTDTSMIGRIEEID